MPDQPNTPADARILLTGAGALQAALTGIGASNGALVAVAINNRSLLLEGVALVGSAVLIGAVLVVGSYDDSRGRRFFSVLAVVALMVGIGVTGYIALLGPSVAKAPNLDVSLRRVAGEFTLVGEVKASGIQEKAHYWVEVDARQYSKSGNHAYYLLGTPLYQGQLGADSQGNIDAKFSVPLGSPKYQAVSVEAWYGTTAGPCGSLGIPGGADLPQATPSAAVAAAPQVKKATTDASADFLDQHSKPGCVVVRLES